MDVSIIIVNYNTLKLTSECIESIHKFSKDIIYEIILIDNASSDGSKEYFSTRHDISYYYNQENIGFGKANNIGIKKAKGRNILFLNSDTLLISNAVKILSDYLDSHVNVGVCGGNLYDSSYNPIHSFQRFFPSYFSEIDILFRSIPSKILYRKNREFNHTLSPIKVAYITGADMMVKKNILNNLGSFDPDFFMYFEETELCNRITKNNYEIHCLPDSKIIHKQGASLESINLSKGKKLFYTSKLLYFQKTHSPKVVSILWKIWLLSILTYWCAHYFDKTNIYWKEMWTFNKNLK